MIENRITTAADEVNERSTLRIQFPRMSENERVQIHTYLGAYNGYTGTNVSDKLHSGDPRGSIEFMRYAR